MEFNCGEMHRTQILEILERFQSKVLRIITDNPWYVPNTVIKRDLQIPTVKHEARKYSTTIQKRLDAHPNNLANALFQEQLGTRSLKVNSHIACRAHAVPLPCRAAKGLEYVFRIWFTQCGRVWFIKMWSENQTRPHCVNQMGKTHSKPLAARHGRGTAWERHAICESGCKRLYPADLVTNG
jgi:hypothetical protein